MLVWHAPLTPEQYDIVIDANKNGVYNAATDGLDSGSPGFVVLATLAAADASGDGQITSLNALMILRAAGVEL